MELIPAVRPADERVALWRGMAACIGWLLAAGGAFSLVVGAGRHWADWAEWSVAVAVIVGLSLVFCALFSRH